MIRVLAYLTMLILAMAGFWWLSIQSGAVSIVWDAWRIDTSAGALAVAVVALAIAAALLYRLWRSVATAPRRFVRWRRDRRLRRGYAALSSGLVAVAAGDPGEARRLARHADRLLDLKPLTLLLQAQAAQLANDEDTAQRLFRSMLERPETEFLGLRGLLARALRDGDQARAIELAKRTRALRPKTPWVLTALLELQSRARDWEGAADTLAATKAVAALPPGELQRHQAAVYLELSRHAVRAGASDDAWRYAKRAYAADAGHAIAASWMAERMADAGKRRRAARLVERAWAVQPHPALLAAYRRAHPNELALEWVKSAERLAALAPAHPDSRRAVGEAALVAGLWGEARRHLGAILADAEGAPPASLCRKLAEIEEADTHDPAAARRWLDLAAGGRPDPAWICATCGAVHAEWQAVCGRCGAFDRLAWRLPDHVPPFIPPPPPAASAALAPPG